MFDVGAVDAVRVQRQGTLGAVLLFPLCLRAVGTSWLCREKVVGKVDSEVLEWNKAASVC